MASGFNQGSSSDCNKVFSEAAGRITLQKGLQGFDPVDPDEDEDGDDYVPKRGEERPTPRVEHNSVLDIVIDRLDGDQSVCAVS